MKGECSVFSSAHKKYTSKKLNGKNVGVHVHGLEIHLRINTECIPFWTEIVDVFILNFTYMILPIGSFGESSKEEKEEKLFVHKIQKQPPEVFYKKAVFKNFAILTGKHLYWSLILIKLQA